MPQVVAFTRRSKSSELFDPRNANELTGDGDHDATDTWRRIITAVAQLANTTQPAPPH
jgi:hypothetical protein